jgi:hypothetical protein
MSALTKPEATSPKSGRNPANGALAGLNVTPD